MVTDQQVRKLFKMQNKYEHLYQVADAAGMSSKTARKFLKSKQLPSQNTPEHNWQTRPDPFKEDWDWIEQHLTEAKGALEGKELFEALQRLYPGKYQDGQLRTLQRRIKVWKALHGPSKETFYPQIYFPGRWCCSDFTCMNSLNVTIQKQLFKHLFYHFVLCYSNWQAGEICYSESFESLSRGLQDALWELGGVPQHHRTDNLTSAVRKVGHPEVFTDKYQALARHYGFMGEKTQPASPNENGDVEKSNHLFKKAVEQALILRGSRDFNSLQEYEQFMCKILERRNQNCQKRFAEELSQLRSLPKRRYEDYEERICKVSNASTIRILHNTYSVHSRLIGENVKVRVYADHLDVWYAQRKIDILPRLRGEDGYYINYRHIIDWLVRKPGAFESYRYKQDLFPTSQFRIAYDVLKITYDNKQANKQYLKILELAAKENESLVNDALRLFIDLEVELSFDIVKQFIESKTKPPAATDVHVEAVDLNYYDKFLESPECVSV
jgi:hypothetical protein